MKRILYIPIFLVLISAFNSCDGVINFLEKAPGVDVTEDTIFSTKTQVETFVAGTYYYGVMSDLPMWDARDKSDCSNAAACDEAEIVQSWYWAQGWNSANMNSNTTRDNRFKTHWSALRRANIIIERIDNAPFNDDAYKQQVRGEAKFIRALNNFELFRKYGGVPIVDHRFTLSENLNIPRSSVEDVVNFIVKDCDDAIADLPNFKDYPTSLRGRATKIAAMALKSRTLLYAASKTFNTATPYIDFGANNKLICYGNYDVNRWKLAADAAKIAIDQALLAGHVIIIDQGVTKNYRYVWETNDNAEIILAEKSKGSMLRANFPWGSSIPQSCGGFGGGLNATFNFTQFYEKADGTPQTWNMNGGSDLLAKYAALDPRFGQTIVYQNQPWNADYPILDFSNGRDLTTGRDISILGRNATITGESVHKPVPYSISSTNGSAIPNGIVFRLAECYLNYAEALNEFYSTPPAEAYDAVDVIRKRSGMPVWPRTLTQEQFRTKIRNERAVELAYEGHRLYDIRRWEIAENDGVMKGNMYGLKIYKIVNSSGTTTECRYEPYVFEVRTFKTAMYRHPFPQGEIDKGYLIQNPGW
ncbi:MAG: RagB/SusD family nutrient uptake outer membrane protein [Paludibacter sp.]